MLDLDLVWVAEVKDRVTDAMPHLLQQILVEVVVGKLALVSSAEGSFASKRVGDAKFLPHYHAHRRLLLLLHYETAVVEVKQVGVLVKQAWEDAFFKSVVLPA